MKYYDGLCNIDLPRDELIKHRDLVCETTIFFADFYFFFLSAQSIDHKY